MNNKLLIIFAFYCFLGCITSFTFETSLTNKTYPPTSESEIEVFIEKPPDRPYEKLSIITIDDSTCPLARAILKAKHAASKKGADAILLMKAEQANQPGSFVMYGGTAIATGARYGQIYSFYAIKFTEKK